MALPFADTLLFCCCLAQSRISSMNEAFRQQSEFDPSVLLPFLGIVVGAIVLGLAIHFHYNRNQKRQLASDPKSLFRELCEAHSLSFLQRRALRKLYKVRKLSDPGLIFLDIRLWPTNNEAQRLLGGWTRRKLCELRRKLFQTQPSDQPA